MDTPYKVVIIIHLTFVKTKTKPSHIKDFPEFAIPREVGDREVSSSQSSDPKVGL